MPFPVTRTMEGDLDRPLEEALGSVKRGLGHMGAEVQESDLHELSFRVPFINTSTPLSMIDSGVVTVKSLGAERTRVRMELSFRRTAVLLAVLILIFLGGGSIVMSGESWTSIVDTLPFLVVGFLWLLGPWFAIAPSRIRRFLDLEPVTR